MAEEKEKYNLEKIKERLDGAGLSLMGLPNLAGGGISPTCDPGCEIECINCQRRCANGGAIAY